MLAKKRADEERAQGGQKLSIQKRKATRGQLKERHEVGQHWTRGNQTGKHPRRKGSNGRGEEKEKAGERC